MLWTRFAFAFLWLLLVLFLGSTSFAAQETGRFIMPFLTSILPGTPAPQLQALHVVLRKLAHVTEYAVLALLWFRALRGVGGQTLGAAAGTALAVCLVCAFVDEAHQSTLPARQGSARDFLIDAFGATGMLMIARGRQTTGRGGRLDGAIAPEPAD